MLQRVNQVFKIDVEDNALIYAESKNVGRLL